MSGPNPEISKSDSPTDSSRTVKFDVGGRLYKVSRASIEKFPSTMLARMISETWQKDPEVTLFIDRDSDRFRFCLDYMRADKVWLPLNIPKEAFLDDLDFYGFEDVDPHKIHGGSSNLAAAQHLIKCKEEHKRVLSICTENVEAAKTTSDCEEVAFECFVRFSRGGSLEGIPVHRLQGHMLHDSTSVALAVANQEEFQDHLAKYGLALVGGENVNKCTVSAVWILKLKVKEDAIN